MALSYEKVSDPWSRKSNLKNTVFSFQNITLRQILEKWMSYLFEFCRALKCKNATLGMCCIGGKVKLPNMHLPPKSLLTLVSGDINY